MSSHSFPSTKGQKGKFHFHAHQRVMLILTLSPGKHAKILAIGARAMRNDVYHLYHETRVARNVAFETLTSGLAWPCSQSTEDGFLANVDRGLEPSRGPSP